MGCGTSYAGVVAVMAREAQAGRSTGYLETAAAAVRREVDERGLRRETKDDDRLYDTIVGWIAIVLVLAGLCEIAWDFAMNQTAHGSETTVTF